MIDLKEKRITVTGGKGFLGMQLVQNLREIRGCSKVMIADLPEYDLRDIISIRKMYAEQKPEIVIHLAAVVGGIGANRKNPGRFFYDNLIMGVQLLHEAYLNDIEKFVAIGTICAYPKFTPVPFKEEDLWNGYPEETNAPYGLAKKMMLVQSQAYRQQYGFNSIFLLPVNLYGPGDNFDPETSHVIPALIKKFVDAMGGKQNVKEKMRKQSSGNDDNIILGKDAPISVWGTGSASREFIFTDDAMEGIILATERYDKPDPVNIGCGYEITIKELVLLIKDLIGYSGEITWDSSKPDGQPRRMLDTSRAEAEFGFKARIGLKEGLLKTIEWYLFS